MWSAYLSTKPIKSLIGWGGWPIGFYRRPRVQIPLSLFYLTLGLDLGLGLGLVNKEGRSTFEHICPQRRIIFLMLRLVSQYALQWSVITSSTILLAELARHWIVWCPISLVTRKTSSFVPRQTSIQSLVPAEATAEDPQFNGKIYTKLDLWLM